MVSAIRRLLTFYDGHNISSVAPVYSDDAQSVTVLQLFHPVMLTDHCPQSVIGDGNCLFRSASVGLYGHEDAHVYLRLLSALEMVEHRSRYDRMCAEHVRDKPDYHELLNVTTYDRMISEVTKVGEWCDLMHVYALSAALGVVVKSYIPPVSHDIAYYSIYTRDIICSGVDPTSPAQFTVMWSATEAPSCPSDFKVNHVVLLMRRHPSTQTVSQPAVVAPTDISVCDDSLPNDVSSEGTPANESHEYAGDLRSSGCYEQQPSVNDDVDHEHETVQSGTLSPFLMPLPSTDYETIDRPLDAENRRCRCAGSACWSKVRRVRCG